MKKVKLLITGSAGFIMGNYIRRLVYLSRKYPNKYNYVISSIDNVRYGGLNAIYNNKGHNFHIADLTNKHILDIIFKLERPDIVIHGASVSDKTASLNELLHNNVVGTQNLIDMCVKYNVKRIISLKKYNNNYNYINDVDKSQKMACELFSSAHNKYKLNYSLLEVPAVFGPRQFLNNFIPRIIKAGIKKESISVNEGAHNWIHVFDVCSALNKILEQNSEEYLNFQYGIYNYENYDNITLAVKIFNTLGSNPILIYKNTDINKSYLVPTYDGIGVNLSDIEWEPEFDNFDQLLNDTINWYSKNNWFFNTDR